VDRDGQILRDLVKTDAGGFGRERLRRMQKSGDGFFSASQQRLRHVPCNPHFFGTDGATDEEIRWESDRMSAVDFALQYRIGDTVGVAAVTTAVADTST